MKDVVKDSEKLAAKETKLVQYKVEVSHYSILFCRVYLFIYEFVLGFLSTSVSQHPSIRRGELSVK